MARSREDNEDRGEVYHYEAVGLSKGAGDPDTYGYPGEPQDTEPVEMPEAF